MLMYIQTPDCLLIYLQLKCIGLADVELSSGPEEHGGLFGGMPADLGDKIDEGQYD